MKKGKIIKENKLSRMWKMKFKFKYNKNNKEKNIGPIK